MVTFNNAGRLGNWMMEAATCVGYAMRHELEFSFPNHTNHPKDCPVYLTHLYKPLKQGVPTIQLWETRHNYEPLEFKEEWRNCNIIIEGYRQTEKYFKHCEDFIRELFNPEWSLIEGLVSVHVRRGDYLVLREKHPEVTKQWYEEAMAMFPNKQFVFFSDDINWCKENFGDRSDCTFSEWKDELTDVRLISCCEHHINSSSTFSWWGAWLNRSKDKKVVTPKLWFTENWSGLDTSDIIPETWVKL